MDSQEKIVRDVTIPEVITVQELANRMAERGADVVKALMKMGVMATINQTIDADTAELLAQDFGHRVKRVSEADVEVGIEGAVDRPEEMKSRPPVVTIMGHVDHGKTSLLDALRKTDVVAKEAGGITQHIGAYQIVLPTGGRITFLDTPGHEAFTSMRARGAKTTDIVVLVVAADDSVMPQTVEAIRHAKAAEVPMIVAINKCDLPAADPNKVRTELLQYEVVVEEMGGDVQTIEVSAKTGDGLTQLEEAILLQAEILELQANPDRAGQGTVIEAKIDRGRGAVATVLVQRGTIRVGDIFVAGSEWGRVRALVNDRGEQVKEAGPAEPIEVLGLTGAPLAGDDFVVVDNEGRAREIAEFRQRKKREADQLAAKRGTLEQMFAQAQAGEVKQLAVVIKGDVQGSVEAIQGSLEKLVEDNEEVNVRVLHAAVGAITESDITLAASTGAMVIGFNVRAHPQARDLAKRDGVEIRYYSVIYNVIDDVRNALSGMLAPTVRENFIGYAQIREVFSITKVGKVAGCMITDGVVRRGAGVRLLRDDVVIHEGRLKTLKRFKDEVREVREGYECGMAFENYDDIKVGDVIECYETEDGYAPRASDPAGTRAAPGGSAGTPLPPVVGVARPACRTCPAFLAFRLGVYSVTMAHAVDKAPFAAPAAPCGEAIRPCPSPRAAARRNCTTRSWPAVRSTVTEVRVSPDLKNATVFVRPLGGGDTADWVARCWRDRAVPARPGWRGRCGCRISRRSCASRPDTLVRARRSDRAPAATTRRSPATGIRVLTRAGDGQNGPAGSVRRRMRRPGPVPARPAEGSD